MAPRRTSDALLKANQNLMAILTKPEDDARQAQQTNPLYPPRSTSTGELPAARFPVWLCTHSHHAAQDHTTEAAPPPSCRAAPWPVAHTGEAPLPRTQPEPLAQPTQGHCCPRGRR